MVTRNSTNHPVCRIGFVGTGGVATRHAQVLSGFDDVALVAATDVELSAEDVTALDQAVAHESVVGSRYAEAEMTFLNN